MSARPLFAPRVEVVDKALAGCVVSRDHMLVKGFDDQGRVVGVRCNADGQAVKGAHLELVDLVAYPRAAALAERRAAGGRS